MKAVKDLKIGKKQSVDEIVRQMGAGGGFSAKNLALGVDILEKMLKDKDSLNFLSFPADIISTGLRGVIKDMVKKKWFSLLITTCGTLDHDLARSFKDYYQGSFDVDDAELHRKGINRIGNVFVPNESYGIIIEDKMQKWLKEIYSERKEFSTQEFCWEIGKRLKDDSILYWAWKNSIPVIVPGITDGAVGYQLWQFYQLHKDLKIDLLKDEQLLNDLTWRAKHSGALVIGGGISKHHTIWWAQFAKGLDSAVYITTAQEYDGSLSGARTREAISWGKLKEKAKHVTIDGDATIILPIVFSSLLERLP